MKIQTVIFDLDNTLYDYDAAHERAFASLTRFAQRELGVEAAVFRDLHRTAMKEQQVRAETACAAIHNRLIRYQLILEALRKPIRYAPAMLDAYWTVFLDEVRPFPGVREVWTELRAAGYSVGVGTNMTADFQYEKLKRLHLLDTLDYLVTSEEVNAEKPDRRLFDACAEKAGCPSAACLFVGDNFIHDVQGAAGAGMIPVWFTPAEKGIPEQAEGPTVFRQIVRMEELPPLLHGLSKQREEPR